MRGNVTHSSACREHWETVVYNSSLLWTARHPARLNTPYKAIEERLVALYASSRHAPFQNGAHKCLFGSAQSQKQQGREGMVLRWMFNRQGPWVTVFITSPLSIARPGADVPHRVPSPYRLNMAAEAALARPGQSVLIEWMKKAQMAHLNNKRLLSHIKRCIVFIDDLFTSRWVAQLLFDRAIWKEKKNWGIWTQLQNNKWCSVKQRIVLRGVSNKEIFIDNLPSAHFLLDSHFLNSVFF